MTAVVRLTEAERRSTKLLTAREVARQYGLPLRTVIDLRARGQFPPAVRIGHRVYWTRETLDAWINAATEDRPAAEVAVT
jgi:predicted DNA-binding transcriptional regulator AlpA